MGNDGTGTKLTQNISNMKQKRFNLKEEEEVPVTSLHFYDNKLAVDHLMSKPHGLFYLIDDATRGRHAQEFITGKWIIVD